MTEKDKYGATDIYSLAQFKGVRKEFDLLSYATGFMAKSEMIEVYLK